MTNFFCLRGLTQAVLAAAAMTNVVSSTVMAEGQIVEFVGEDGDIKVSEDVSAIAKVGRFLVLGSDEAVGKDTKENIIQVFQPAPAGPAGETRYAWHRDISLFKGSEMDIEGIATKGNVVYVIGSHSKKRKKQKSNKKYDTNLKRFHEEKIKPEVKRGRIYRLELGPDGAAVAGPEVQETLADVIAENEVLKLFSAIPSKENGVDIEGLAADGDWIYAGFRGPVLREGYVPVLRLQVRRSRQ